MHPFRYVGGVLHAEDVSLARIAEDVGTPFYCYSSAALEGRYRELEDACAELDARIFYALKANSNQAVIKTFARLGAGMDVVSAGELKRARAAGVPGERIIFAGVGKTREEMAYALGEDICGFNVESEDELEALNGVAQSLGRRAAVAVRVNPDVDAKTHAKISTGTAESKFGVPFNDAARLYDRAAELPGLSVAGLHVHIGSQITDLTPFRNAFMLMAELSSTLRARGHRLAWLDVGGGLGVAQAGEGTTPSPREYARLLKETLGPLDLRLMLEPGRMLVANAGVLITRVIRTKTGRDKTFTVVDAAMNDLIRPTLYEAAHAICPVLEARASGAPIAQDVVGPVCEAGDYLARARQLPRHEAGDLLALMSAGAYGAAMSSTYNTRPLIAEVLVRDGAWAIVRPRQSLEELIALDRLPPWLA